MKLSEELTHRLILVQKRQHPSIIERGILSSVFSVDVNIAGDWRTELENYLRCLRKRAPYAFKMKALNYVLLEGELYRKGFDGLLLRCVGFPDALEIMK